MKRYPTYIFRSIFAILAVLLFSYRSHAQVNAGNDTIICSGTSATLTATTLVGNSTSYSISAVPYNPMPYSGGTYVTMSDDSRTNALPIGFTFEFFGTCYTDFYIGSNGWVGFSAAQPTAYTSAPIPSVATNVPKNCIMGPWQDWHPGTGVGPYINYQVLGAAPFRRLVVSWDNCPMFSCTSLHGTFQIVIYETTNIIENYIQDKPNCTTWAGGTAVQGLHDASGSVAYTVSGRNSTQWTASNEGWRYTPASSSIVWMNGPAIIGPGPSITVSPTANSTIYTAQVTTCGTTYTDDVTVTLAPAPTLTTSGNAVVCAGNSAALSASGGTSYTWSPATGLSATTGASVTAAPPVTTTYTVTGTTAGCNAVGNVTVTVNPYPNADAGSNTGVCPGGSVQLQASGGSSYTWSPAATLSNPNISNPVASPGATTTYTVAVTDNGCTSIDSVMVSYNLLPTVTASDISFCPGSNGILNATGASTYTWSPAAGLSSTTGANPVASPTVTTTYTLTGTSSSGCQGSDQVIVTVNPRPAISAGSDVNICPGSSAMLNATGGNNYSWAPSSSLNNNAIPNPTASPSATTTYVVTGFDANGCSNNDTVVVNVTPMTITMSPAASVCAGSGVQISASAAGATAYTWSPAAGLSSSTAANPMASPSVTTTYSVVASNGAGCSTNGTVIVNVNALPPAAINPANIAVCPGASASLTASGGVSYAWSPATGLSAVTGASVTAAPSSTTTYTVTVTDNNSCVNTAISMITVNQLPVADAGASQAMCVGGSVPLNAAGGISYTWSPAAGLSTTTGAAPTANPLSTTTYTVTVTDASGCVDTDVTTVTVNPLPVADAGQSSSFCQGGSTTLNASGGGTYAWSPATGLSSSTSANPVASPSATTTYTLTVTSAAGCISGDVVTVSVNSNPSLGLSSQNAVCGNNDGQVSMIPTGGTSPYAYSINGSMPQQVTSFTNLAPGTYTVTIVDANGCTSNQSISIAQILNVNAAFTAVPVSGQIPLNVAFTNNSTGANNYVWSFGNNNITPDAYSVDANATYTSAGNYQVMLVAYNNDPACADTAFITIHAEDLVIASISIPNVFTPNGDGMNDIFRVQSTGLQSISASVFDRWGKKVAEWDGAPAMGWDGKTQGGALADDGV
jgi:gliding motility-associated-like protein